MIICSNSVAKTIKDVSSPCFTFSLDDRGVLLPLRAVRSVLIIKSRQFCSHSVESSTKQLLEKELN